MGSTGVVDVDGGWIGFDGVLGVDCVVEAPAAHLRHIILRRRRAMATTLWKKKKKKKQIQLRSTLLLLVLMACQQRSDPFPT